MKGVELKWVVEDANGKVLEWHRTRADARDAKEWYEENMFADWQIAMKMPLKINREQWELVDRKVVR